MSLDDMLEKIIDQCILPSKETNKIKDKDIDNTTSGNVSSNVVTNKDVNNKRSQTNINEEILNSIGVNFGTILVTEDGVKVKGKRNKDVLARLTPCQGVKVLVNNVEVKETIEVSEDDLILIKCHTETIPGNIEVEVYEKEAYINVRSKKVVNHTLVKQPEQRNITLQTKTDTIIIPFLEQELYQCLQQSGVNYGINYGLLQEIIINQSEGRFLIASAKEPILPEDDQIVVLFTEDTPLIDLNNMKIDLNSIKSVPSVESDTVLAVRRPGKAGIPGISVTGQPILPREPKHIELLAGKGTVLINQGNAVIASKSGRPILRQGKNRWQVAIEECLVVYGDIDISTGNQIFKGSVKIMGNVQDGMKVHAGGRIDIKGYCSKSEIIAMEHIKVKSIIGSSVQAGIKSKHFVTCKNDMYNLKEQLVKLTSTYKQLVHKIDDLSLQVRAGHIILVLIDKHYKDVPKLLRKTVKNFKILPMELPDFTTRLIQMIQANLPPINLTIDRIQDIIDAITQTEEFLFSGETIANIYTENILTSFLACTGNIYVQGEGCINSKIFSGANIFIDDVVRGGLLSARTDITVGELGSRTGVPIVVKTKEGKVMVNKIAHAGVILQIAGFKKTLYSDTGPIIAYANEKGITIKPLL